MKMELNMVLIIGIVVMGAIAIVSLIKGASNEIVVGAIAATAGLLTGPVVSKAAPGLTSQTVSPVDNTSLGGNSADPTIDPTITQDPTVGATTAAATVTSTIDPNDLITQAVSAIQNNPTILNSVITAINAAANNQSLLSQIQTVLTGSNGDLNLISAGIANVQSLINAANTAPASGA